MFGESVSGIHTTSGVSIPIIRVIDVIIARLWQVISMLLRSLVHGGDQYQGKIAPGSCTETKIGGFCLSYL